MKTERRHELQTNELADWVSKHYKTVAPYTKTIVGVVIALVVGYTAWNFISSRSQAREATEWDQFGNQNKEDLNALVARNSIGTPLGNLARLSLADINLSDGLGKLLTNRAEALRSLDSAREDYALVANNSKDPTVTQLAWCGKAKSEEALGHIKEAIADYEKLAIKGKLSIFYDYATQRITELKRPSVKEFYTTLAESGTAAPEPPKSPATDLDNFGGDKTLPGSPLDKSSIFNTLPDKTSPLPKAPDFPPFEKTDDKSSVPPTTPDAAPDAPAASKTPDAAPETPAPKTPDAKSDTPAAPKTTTPATPAPKAPATPAPKAPKK